MGAVFMSKYTIFDQIKIVILSELKLSNKGKVV